MGLIWVQNGIMCNLLKNIAMNLYQGNIGTANSEYFNALNDLQNYKPFIEKAEVILKLQENEDWIGLADIFSQISSPNS